MGFVKDQVAQAYQSSQGARGTSLAIPKYPGQSAPRPLQVQQQETPKQSFVGGWLGNLINKQADLARTVTGRVKTPIKKAFQVLQTPLAAEWESINQQQQQNYDYLKGNTSTKDYLKQKAVPTLFGPIPQIAKNLKKGYKDQLSPGDVVYQQQQRMQDLNPNLYSTLQRGATVNDKTFDNIDPNSRVGKALNQGNELRKFFNNVTNPLAYVVQPKNESPDTFKARTGLAYGIATDPLSYAKPKDIVEATLNLKPGANAASFLTRGQAPDKEYKTVRQLVGLEKLKQAVQATPQVEAARELLSTKAPSQFPGVEEARQTRNFNIRRAQYDADQAAKYVASLPDDVQKEIQAVSSGQKYIDEVTNPQTRLAIKNLDLKYYGIAKNIDATAPGVSEAYKNLGEDMGLTATYKLSPDMADSFKGDFIQSITPTLQKSDLSAKEIGKVSNSLMKVKVNQGDTVDDVAVALREALAKSDTSYGLDMSSIDNSLAGLADRYNQSFSKSSSLLAGGNLKGAKTVYRGTLGQGEIDNILNGKTTYTDTMFRDPTGVEVGKDLSQGSAGLWSTSKSEARKYAEGLGFFTGDSGQKTVGTGNYLLEGKQLKDGTIIPVKAVDIYTNKTIDLLRKSQGEDIRPLYLGPRLFNKNEFKDVQQISQRGPMTLEGSRFAARAEKSAADVAALGGEAPLPYETFKGLSQEQKNVQLFKFYDNIDKQGLAKPAEQAAKNDIILSGKEWGNLDGKAVPQTLGMFLQNEKKIYKYPTGPLAKAMDWLTRQFKAGKTVLNPAQQARNAYSNQLLLYLNEPASVGNMPTAVGEIMSKGKYYKEYQATGNMLHNYTQEDILKLSNPQYLAEDLQKLANKNSGPWNKVIEQAGKVQGFSEDSAKLQMFIYQRQNGASIQKAVKAANDALFDYGDVTPFEKAYLRRLFAFYTFNRKSIPIVAKTLSENPVRISNLYKVQNAIEGLSASQAPDESQLPPYMRDMVRLPVKDKLGNYKYLNMKYLYPWGSYIDDSRGLNIPGGFSLNPVINEGAQQLLNEDFYFNKPISSSNVKDVAVKQRLSHALATFTPTVANTIPQKAIPALLGKPDYQGRQRDIKDVGLDQLLGIKMYPFDEKARNTTSYLKDKRVSDISREISAAKKGKDLDGNTITPSEAERRIEQLTVLKARIKANLAE